jgi:hypothetical protein
VFENVTVAMLDSCFFKLMLMRHFRNFVVRVSPFPKTLVCKFKIFFLGSRGSLPGVLGFWGHSFPLEM